MADVEPGRVLGDRFEVVGVLGHGGMATVYLAKDRLRDEAVALKVLHAHLAKSAAWRSRLRREVHTASRLRHPHALVASDLHELDGTLAVSMPLHPGRTLGEYVERHGPLTGQGLGRVAKQLAGALREAHGAGLVHRDVTPTNVMIDDAGDAVLTDFGLARFTDQRTATGTGVLGTAGYAAPEVYKGVRGDPRSDLYGLGAVLYQAATGSPPFAAPDPVGVLQKQLADERVPLREARPDIPAHLAEAIDRLLAPDPEARPQAAAEVLDLLERRHTRSPFVAVGEAKGPAGSAASHKAPARGPIGLPRAPHLPHGSWSVVVSERGRDRDRRRAVRKWAERQRAADLGADVERVVGEVKRRVMGLMNIDPGKSPEERLANAVAREASLPPDALVVPPGMLERRFRLVESVSEDSALRLVAAAEESGFRAVPWRLGEPAARRTRAPARFLFTLLSVLIGLFGIGLLNELVPGTPLEQVVALVREMPFLVFVVVIPFWRFFAPEWEVGANDRLPVAFGKDLRFHLAPNVDVTLPPLAAEPEPVALPAAPKAPVSRHTPVIERARAQLAAFDEALAASDRLPEAAVRDLRGTSADLRERIEALASRVLALDQELGRLDDAGAAAAADRVEARLERLRTLSRAGRSDGTDEIASLERALATHRDVLDRSEALEGQLTLAVARLLETGASAAHARLELIEAVEPGRSADDLLVRLRVQTEGARLALAELDGSPDPAPLPRDPLPATAAWDRGRLRDPA